MKRFAILSALALISTASFAADMPVKAPVLNPVQGYPYNSSGIYWGVTALGENAKTGLAGPAGSTGDIFQVGAAAGLTVGYQKGNGTTFYAVEVTGVYQNIGASQDAAPAGSVNTRWQAFERVKFGMPVAAIATYLPSFAGTFPGLPTISGGSGTTHGYIMAGLHEDDVSAQYGLMSKKAWQLSPSIGIGVMQQLTAGLVGDAWVEIVKPAAGITLGVPGGVAKVQQGNKYLVGLSVLY